MRKSGIVRIARRKSRRRRSSIPQSTSGGPCAISANGKIKSESYGDKSLLPLRGGSYWGNESRAGVFALNLNNPRTLSNANVGFRAASPPHPDIQSLRALFQSRGIKGFAPLPRSGQSESGADRRFLCAAATGMTPPGRACSRSISGTRARTVTAMLVSAPLHPRSRIFKAHGPCFRAEGIKGLASGPKPQSRGQKQNSMEAVSNPIWANTVTHGPFGGGHEIHQAHQREGHRLRQSV